jgi:tetratricopeptide (TPR) repeat protein
MSPRPLALLAALAAWLAAAGPARAAAAFALAPSSAEDVRASERELDAGLADYGRADYASAITHFERAYALHPSPQYLYAWAQAARSMGDCATAIELYRRFIAAGATGASLQAARQNEARCADELAAKADADARSDAASEPVPAPAPEPAPLVADVPSEPERPRRSPDGLGIALVVTGGVALGAGSALLAVASARRATQA